jgi:hypothetical protein
LEHNEPVEDDHDAVEVTYRDRGPVLLEPEVDADPVGDARPRVHRAVQGHTRGEILGVDQRILRRHPLVQMQPPELRLRQQPLLFGERLRRDPRDDSPALAPRDSLFAKTMRAKRGLLEDGAAELGAGPLVLRSAPYGRRISGDTAKGSNR